MKAHGDRDLTGATRAGFPSTNDARINRAGNKAASAAQLEETTR